MTERLQERYDAVGGTNAQGLVWMFDTPQMALDARRAIVGDALWQGLPRGKQCLMASRVTGDKGTLALLFKREPSAEALAKVYQEVSRCGGQRITEQRTVQALLMSALIAGQVNAFHP